MTPERAAEIIAAYSACGSVRGAAAALGMAKSTFHAELVAARALENTPDGFTTASVATTVDGQGEPRSHAIRARRGEASEPYRMPDGHALARLSSLVDASGRVIQEWRISTPESRTIADIGDALRAELADAPRLAPILPPPAGTESDLLTLYPIVDHHHGLYAWKPEAGANYDVEESERLLREHSERVAELAPASDTAIILGLGDFLHADGHDAVTVASRHQLDRDGRQARVIRSGFRLLRWRIDLALAKHARVHVTIRAGNHDPMSALHFALMLSIAYEAEPRVAVDLDPSLFWFATWGRVLLGATHGHTVKPKDFASVMAAECGEAWGQTEFRYGFQGHIHHETRVEKGGAIVETLQTLAAKDAWGAGHGYAAGRSMSAITYHKELGEVSRVKACLPNNDRAERVVSL